MGERAHSSGTLRSDKLHWQSKGEGEWGRFIYREVLLHVVAEGGYSGGRALAAAHAVIDALMRRNS